jgi:hypothetical protein
LTVDRPQGSINRLTPTNLPCPEAEGAAGLRRLGFDHINAKIIVRRFRVRMTFVPEGQADRSQARSAWDNATPKEAVP